MGVPKFYRWISERYPCLSEIVREAQIPDFDNLYLDMNGIIHNCSHPNDSDVHFRISEEEIFRNIFKYIEFLFRMIKPKKVFFMAVDGVAPRAKMNQQRGRRFRSAKEAELKEAEARKRGEKLPDEVRFDSNCITPGTDFMVRLHEQLKYFVRTKVSTDEAWQGLQIYLSGHETPGEGEHKIMDFIRYQKTQPDHDPRTRHCLYGLDADLIKLGLCSHEPNFALLREEVKFGSSSSSKKGCKTVNPEAITFHLLHLSLLREYIDLEFSQLKQKLPFAYNLENIIDDWVLMGFLVGNDFIPHIPHFHIKKNSLSTLYQIYIETLPQLDGYLNEHGILNLQRFQIFLEKLADVDKENFSERYADLKYFDAKRIDKKLENEIADGEEFVCQADVRLGKDDYGEDSHPSDELEDEEDDLLEEEFKVHKKDYYETKLMYEHVDDEVLKQQAYGYIRAIQWNLHYYYNGCVSWSWYYPHHYAPYISDIKNFKDVDLNFDLGEPFKPYEQLLAVLPSASKACLPKAYQKLVTDESSPLIDYYPENFDMDLNEKMQAWEAVVLIPFIDEEKLLAAARSCADSLTEIEKSRNKHGPHLLFIYTPDSLPPCPSPLPEAFPDIVKNHALCQELDPYAFRLPMDRIVQTTNVAYEFMPGFPTLKHIEFKASLRSERVKVFDQFSQGNNMMLDLIVKEAGDVGDVANSLLGNAIYVNWPHLVEAKAVKVVSTEIKYVLNKDGKIEQSEVSDAERIAFGDHVKSVSNYCHTRKGIVIGETEVLVYVLTLVGRKYEVGADGMLTIVKQWSTVQSPYPYQITVQDLQAPNLLGQKFITLEDLFPVGKNCFILAPEHYGAIAEILEINNPQKRLKVKVSRSMEPDLTEIISRKDDIICESYMPNFVMSQKLNISGHTLSRITGSILVFKSSRKGAKINIGLNLKLNSKSMEVPGYSKRKDGQWLFSEKTYSIVENYLVKFPFIFEKLNRHVDADYFELKDLFPFPNPEEKLNEVLSWLKSLPCADVKRQRTDAELLDVFVVKAVEDVLDCHKVFCEELSSQILWLKSSLLFRCVPHLGLSSPDPSIKFSLFDRVVNVRSDLPVPLGAKGVVIGLHIDESNYANSQFDIVFDDEFVGALDLNCSANRGYRMSLNSLLNVSQGNKSTKNRGVLQKTRDLCCIQTPSRRDRQSQRPDEKRPNLHRNQFRQVTNNSQHQMEPAVKILQKPIENIQITRKFERSPHSNSQPSREITRKNVFRATIAEQKKNVEFNSQSWWTDLTNMQQTAPSQGQAWVKDNSAPEAGPSKEAYYSDFPALQTNANKRMTFDDLVKATSAIANATPLEETAARRDLRIYCMETFGREPVYKTDRMGPMKNIFHTLILPNTERLTDCATSGPPEMAYERLAIKAMKQFKETYVPQPEFLSADSAGPQLPKPPGEWIARPSLRDQTEVTLSGIPESFVLQNQVLMHEHRQNQVRRNLFPVASAQVNYAAMHTVPDVAESLADVAILRPNLPAANKGINCLKASLNATAPPFVPPQVARRNQHMKPRIPSARQPPAPSQHPPPPMSQPTSQTPPVNKTNKANRGNMASIGRKKRVAANFSNAPK